MKQKANAAWPIIKCADVYIYMAPSHGVGQDKNTLSGQAKGAGTPPMVNAIRQ
jgi:hypothetical protein